MKYAAAMRYGGELVDAIDCDYEDYKYLGLLCPECKEPVFLRASGIRVVKDKEIPIGAHFCHFKTKDIELAKSCEQRVGGYTVEEIERRSAVARGQRLKILQTCFWDIVKGYPCADNGGITVTIQESLVTARLFFTKIPPLSLFTESVVECFLIKDNFSRLSQDFLEFVKSDHQNTEKAEIDTLFNKKIQHLRAGIDIAQHGKIVQEVYCFLTSKCGRKVLEKLCMAFSTPSFVNFEWFDKPLDRSAQASCLEALSDLIWSTPWAEAFAKIEKQHTIASNEHQRSPKLRRSRSTSSGKGFAIPKP